MHTKTYGTFSHFLYFFRPPVYSCDWAHRVTHFYLPFFHLSFFPQRADFTLICLLHWLEARSVWIFIPFFPFFPSPFAFSQLNEGFSMLLDLGQSFFLLCSCAYWFSMEFQVKISFFRLSGAYAVLRRYHTELLFGIAPPIVE